MMRLLPIPRADDTYINGLFPHWFPFLKYIAKRSKEPIADLVIKIWGHDVQPILIWDEDAKCAVAFLGIRYHQRGDDRIAEWVWMTGFHMKQWTHLLPELERYLREHEGVTELRPLCRPGWSRILSKNGYRITHYQMEKIIGGPHGQ